MSNKTLFSQNDKQAIAGVVAIAAGILLGLIVLVGIIALIAWAITGLVAVIFAGAFTISFIQAFAGVILLWLLGSFLFRR